MAVMVCGSDVMGSSLLVGILGPGVSAGVAAITATFALRAGVPVSRFDDKSQARRTEHGLDGGPPGMI
jgi:hypothetical protein